MVLYEACKQYKKLLTEDTTQTTTPTISMDDTKKRILELIKNNDTITKAEIGKMLNMTKDGAKYHIKKLTEDGYIKHIGNTLTGRWIILKQIE